MHQIHSTGTAPQNYAVWKEGPGGIPVKARDVIINGGHGLTNLRGELLQGAVTEVDDETLRHLEQDESFKAHVAAGYMVVSRKKDHGAELHSMEQRDKAAPGTQQDVEQMYDDGVIPMPVEVFEGNAERKRRRSA